MTCEANTLNLRNPPLADRLSLGPQIQTGDLGFRSRRRTLGWAELPVYLEKSVSNSSADQCTYSGHDHGRDSYSSSPNRKPCATDSRSGPTTQHSTSGAGCHSLGSILIVAGHSNIILHDFRTRLVRWQ